MTDSNAIAYYVANQQLRGRNDFEKAQVLQWLSFADSEALPPTCSWVFPVLGIMQFNKQVLWCFLNYAFNSLSKVVIY